MQGPYSIIISKSYALLRPTQYSITFSFMNNITTFIYFCIGFWYRFLVPIPVPYQIGRFGRLAILVMDCIEYLTRNWHCYHSRLVAKIAMTMVFGIINYPLAVNRSCSIAYYRRYILTVHVTCKAMPCWPNYQRLEWEQGARCCSVEGYTCRLLMIFSSDNNGQNLISYTKLYTWLRYTHHWVSNVNVVCDILFILLMKVFQPSHENNQNLFVCWW